METAVTFNYLSDIPNGVDITFNEMIVRGSTPPINYEPYIDNTEIDVTLPALPTFSSTNTLSVGTTVQPSKIWIQGNVSEMPAQNLNFSPQSLQTFNLSENPQMLEFENNSLQPDVMPIEKPVLNLNDVSEIENAEIERGVESAE